MIERLAADVLQDTYFNDLYNKAAKMFAKKMFISVNNEFFWVEKEVRDLLRFADILSNSSKVESRNKAYQIITLLNKDFNKDPYYRTFAHSVLAKLGNFPGIEYLRNEDGNNSELPLERDIEKKTKEFRQAVPGSRDLIFTDSQFELYTKITSSKHFSFSGPTSMGKSFIIKSFIRRVVANVPAENIVIMVPTRALINQFSIDLNRELKEVLDSYNYSVVTNSNVSEMDIESIQRYVFVLTPERLLSYLSQKGNPSFGYLFIDEAHKLAAENDARSITAYSAISKSLKQNRNVSLYFASPNVSNPEVFLRLFKKDEKLNYKTQEAPVSQNLFFIDLTSRKVVHYLESESYEFEPDILNGESSTYDVLSVLGKNTSNLVYCSSKNEAIDKAEKMAGCLKDIKVSNNVRKVIRQIKGYIHNDYYLAEFLNKSVAYHFGNLPQIIRNKIEALFKEREISYIFCTSTLLEGVNMPAKNVFILNNMNGRTPFQPIDFWNLAGRAGRLRYELSGNIICLKESDRVWKKSEELLMKKADILLNPSIDSHIDSKLKLIEQILNEDPKVKYKNETLKEILKYISNIISIDTLEIERSNYRSEIITKLIQDNKELIIELAKKKNGKIEVPSSVLSTNNSIKLKIQNEIYIWLQNRKDNPASIRLPSRVDYETCKEWLNRLFVLFKWQNEEKSFKSKSQLDYYALLMNQWINGLPLNQIINQSIAYYSNTNRQISTGYDKSGLKFEYFDGSKQHVNILIGNIIEDVEHVLRFLLEKYFNSYYVMLVEILGEDNAGANWATFLEYGTQKPIVIALQNYGLSRHSADFIFKNFKSCLKIEGDKLVEIDRTRLRILLDKDAIEYDEINSILF
ncbi:Helicase conserved C-terminal domain-containing protein [Filimonas lacunae]|uniref:Helicase conserved C-terminal domain-containing protein n=1 Tax=Filimonas lacunae TaxID=477680 RepID=A0A173MHX5_9BACT|nr:DEAD/DEAH box helicase [Filimonas lacunae]BAV07223.1 helicase conserved C-terminal domain protein [Filimonas lacunae]SIS93000.1 Helicase conserved C-terminal domain-containing protein [Filimonas lacunae]